MKTSRPMAKCLFMIGFTAMAAACAEEFDPAGKLNATEAQMLGIRAEPPEVGGGDTLTLDALLHFPQGEPHYLWLICIPTKLEELSACVSSQIGADLPPPCDSGVPATLCTASVDSSFSYVVPPIPLPPDVPEILFFVQLVVSPEPDVWGQCAQNIRDNRPTADCMIGLKNVIYSSRDVKNANPRISHFVVGNQPIEPGTAYDAAAGEKAEFNVALDLSSLDELRDESEDTNFIFMDMAYYTTCGTLERWEDRWHCVMALDGSKEITCDPIDPNPVKPRRDLHGSCVIHAVVRDNLGGIDWFTQEFIYP